MQQEKTCSRRILEEVFGQGKLEVADQLVAPNVEVHDPANPDARGVAGLKQMATKYRRGFPDLQCTVEEQIAEGDKVVTRWISKGTHEGELEGIGPTGKTMCIRGISIDRFENGKIVESWINWDAAGLLRQLGALGGARPSRPREEAVSTPPS